MTSQRHYAIHAIPAFRVRRVAGCTCGMRGDAEAAALHLQATADGSAP